MRIVSLLPSTTELACALGLESQLVGISHECDHPQSVLHLPQLTSSMIPSGLSPSEIDAFVREAVRHDQSLYAVDAVQLRELEPELILTQGLCDVCAVTPETIEASLRGVSCILPARSQIVSTEGTSIEGIFEDIRRIAKAANVTDRGAHIIAQAEARLKAFSEPLHRPRVLALEWIDPFFSAGHWVPEQIHAAGGISVIGAPGSHSKTLDLEAVLQSNPDMIVVLCCGFDLKTNQKLAEQLRQRPELQGMKAIREGQLWAIDANSYCSRPTLRVVEGVKILSQIFKGEPVDSDQACRIG